MLRPSSIRSNQPPLILIKIINYSILIGLFFILLAIIYIFLIISGEIGEQTKIQENALLAGLVEERWQDTNKLTKLLDDLGKIKNKQNDLRNYIFNEFIQMRVEVYKQQFKILPSYFNVENKSTKGENIYAIIRAFRAFPVEAILLAVPMSSSSIESIAIALAFANYAKDQLYWSRDLIILFVDNGSIEAADIWLSVYHGQKKREGIEIIDNELPAHGGTFIGAFGLDINGDLFDNIEIIYGMVILLLFKLNLIKD
ncbi:hypothetical protein Mgra_00004404 [Meloidogyne graminicola]|uniref:Uncharacterized protein n=1 Tax=Meloidogyne graminicola TaxID=189291 RepID=A0A8S9ZSH4_9BILA|nr:hypothetical protein Mgra_00004404 [Meloidogyne graminicola]